MEKDFHDDDRLVEQHNKNFDDIFKGLQSKVPYKVFYWVMGLAGSLLFGSYLYAHTIEQAAADYKVDQARTNVTKADFEAFSVDMKSEIKALRNSLDRRKDE